MAEIARASKVSQGAISSLLNDRDYGIRVSPKTREKVFRICREMGYVPNDLRALVRMYPEMGAFALLVSHDSACPTEDPLRCRFLKGAMSVLGGLSQSISLAKYDANVDYIKRPEMLPQPVQNGAASKFISLGTPNYSLFEVIRKRELPVVAVDDDIALRGVVSIMADYVEAADLAIQHLIDLGHTHIGILAGPFGSSDRKIADLTHGVRTALEKNGLPLDSDSVIHGEPTFESGSTLLPRVLSSSKKPTAVFCFDDRIAAGALARALSVGLDVPRDLSIIGCGGFDFAGYLSPALTTVCIPSEETGATAVRTADKLVNDRELPDASRITVHTKLVKRATTAAPKS